MTNTPSERPASGPLDPVEVAKRRKRIPLWAVPIFPALLVWGIIYVNGVSNPPPPTNTPDSMGAQVYAKCAGCHGVGGEGGSGPKFASGDLLKVFPKWEDQIHWVNVGSGKWTAETGSKTFGAKGNEKPIDPNKIMPGFGPKGDASLSCSDIVLVVRYEREHFAGAAPDQKLDALAEQIASGAPAGTIPNCAAS